MSTDPKENEKPTEEEVAVPKFDAVEGEEEQEELTDEQMQDLYEEGMSLYKAKKYADASESLGETLQKFVEKYGEVDDQCAKVYYLYGSALLLDYDSNVDVFGGAMQQGPGGDDEEEEEAQTAAAGGSAAGSASPAAAAAADAANAAVPSPQGAEAANTSALDASTSSAKPADPEGENADNLLIAWESLEAARTILTHSKKPDVELQANVFMKLGDVSMNNETWPQAIEDYSNCLSLRKALYARDDRRLLEVHSQLAMCYLFAEPQMLEESLQHYKAAVDICTQNIATYRKVMEGKPTNSKLTAAEAERDMIDSEEIMAELVAKVEELTEALAAPPPAKEAPKETTTMGFGGFGGIPTGAVVNDIGVVSGKGKGAAAAPASTTTTGFGGFGALPAGTVVNDIGVVRGKGKGAASSTADAASAGQKRKETETTTAEGTGAVASTTTTKKTSASPPEVGKESHEAATADAEQAPKKAKADVTSTDAPLTSS